MMWSWQECPAEVNNSELSLVCDQRYGERQMRKIVDLIKNYCNKTNI